MTRFYYWSQIKQNEPPMCEIEPPSFQRHFKQITIDHAKEKKDDFIKIVNFKEFEKVFRCKTIQKN